MKNGSENKIMPDSSSENAMRVPLVDPCVGPKELPEELAKKEPKKASEAMLELLIKVMVEINENTNKKVPFRALSEEEAEVFGDVQIKDMYGYVDCYGWNRQQELKSQNVFEVKIRERFAPNSLHCALIAFGSLAALSFPPALIFLFQMIPEISKSPSIVIGYSLLVLSGIFAVLFVGFRQYDAGPIFSKHEHRSQKRLAYDYNNEYCGEVLSTFFNENRVNKPQESVETVVSLFAGK